MNERHRPAFHFTPPAMWMNDPNGLVYFDGEYHLFYQYHPHSAVWGPMYWGHAVSRDLLEWQDLPIALSPDENGYIFSGSAVVDWNNTAGFGARTLLIVFTYHKDHIETQNLAYSLDRGRTWAKYIVNPIIPNPGAMHDFRDPRVFWHADHWVLVLAAGRSVLFYTSTDLKHWSFCSRFGDGYDATAGVWETPDLFQLPVNGSDSYWVLTIGVGSGAPAGGSGTQYFIGDFDGRTFTPHHPTKRAAWMDHGADFYASQTWNDEPNGRRIVLGWMSNWQYARLTPTETWRGMFSVPRELFLDERAGEVCLVQQPITELVSLRDASLHWRAELLRVDIKLLAGLQGDCLEIVAEFHIRDDVTECGLRVRCGDGIETVIGYDVVQESLFIDRTASGQVEFHPAFAVRHSAALPLTDRILHLRILLDACSVEVFADLGAVVLSDLIFPGPENQGLELYTRGAPVWLESLDIHFLRPSFLRTE